MVLYSRPLKYGPNENSEGPMCPWKPPAPSLCCARNQKSKTKEQKRRKKKTDIMEKSSINDDAEIEKVEFDASEVEYVSYGGEHHLPLIMNLVDQELSEPYSIFTYRYFVYLWPQLSFLVPKLSSFPFFLIWVVFNFLNSPTWIPLIN